MKNFVLVIMLVAIESSVAADYYYLADDQETTVSKTTYYNNPINSGSAYREAKKEADANMTRSCGSKGYALISQKTLVDKTTSNGSTFKEVYEGVWYYRCNS